VVQGSSGEYLVGAGSGLADSLGFRAVVDSYSEIGNEWTSTFEALAKSGVAFILGETLRERAEADFEE
jgi:hypothetical protein